MPMWLITPDSLSIIPSRVNFSGQEPHKIENRRNQPKL